MKFIADFVFNNKYKDFAEKLVPDLVNYISNQLDVHKNFMYSRIAVFEYRISPNKLKEKYQVDSRDIIQDKTFYAYFIGELLKEDIEPSIKLVCDIFRDEVKYLVIQVVFTI
jgi:transcriptional regulatory protein LevR